MIYYNYKHSGKTKVLMGNSVKDCAATLYRVKTKDGWSGTEKECLTEVALHGYEKTVQQDKPLRTAPSLTQRAKLSMVEVINGGLALVDIFKGDLASDDTIIKRAEICAACPLVSETSDGCVSCANKRLGNIAGRLAVSYGRNFINPMISPVHIKPPLRKPISNFYCGFCGCSCLNLVLSKDKHFVNKERSERPANCWVHQI